MEENITTQTIIVEKQEIYPVYIYSLASPLTPDNVRYIGATYQTLKERKRGHVKSAKFDGKQFHNARWIRTLLDIGLEPTIEVIDITDNLNWEECEKYWINQFRAWGFNLTNSRNGGVGVGQNPNSSKPVFQYDKKTGKFIKEWVSAIEVFKLLNISNSQIGDCCCGRAKSAGGYLWSFERKNKHFIEIFRPIYQYDKSGIFMKKWFNAKEVYDTLKLSFSSLSECCYKRKKTSGGYFWSFEKFKIFIYKKKG